MARFNATSSILSISIYFLLNLFVTLSSKPLMRHLQSAPLLTSSHAAITFFVTSVLSWKRTTFSEHRKPEHSTAGGRDGINDKNDGFYSQQELAPNFRATCLHHAHILTPFGLLYTINILVSNWTL